MEKLRVEIRKILIVLLVIWMVVVFLLSNQNGDSSSSLSMGLANVISGGDVVESQTIEPMIRKIAHMVEYAIGAMIFYGITLTYPQIPNKARFILSLIFIVVYAGTDELHQSYVDSRNGSVWDVLIDTVGGIIGIGAVNITGNSIRAIDNRVQESIDNE